MIRKTKTNERYLEELYEKNKYYDLFVTVKNENDDLGKEINQLKTQIDEAIEYINIAIEESRKIRNIYIEEAKTTKDENKEKYCDGRIDECEFELIYLHHIKSILEKKV